MDLAGLEARLRDSEARYLSAMSALHEGVFVTDASGALLSCNPAAERIIGSSWSSWRETGLIAPGWQPLRADGTPMPVGELPVARVLAGEGPQIDTLLSALDPGGRLAVLEISSVPLTSEPSGTLTGSVTSFTDVTERRQQEEELQAYRRDLEAVVSERTAELKLTNIALSASRDEAQQATRAKSAFLANMSHEIRTPMNAIIGLTHLVTRETRDARQRDRLEKIGVAAEHLLAVLNDILDLSKVEAGKLELERVEFDFPETLRAAIDLIAPRARAKGLALRVDIDSVPSRLSGDPTRLAQMIINLLTNAEKFTATGWIGVKARVLATDGPRINVQVDVQDTGIGIPFDKQANLFNAFVQADDSITRQHGGTGLGLALTRQLAAAMGGEVGIASQPGKGSTFWVSVWLHRGRHVRKRGEPLPFGEMRALVVDAELGSLVALDGALRSRGMQVELLGSGLAALSRAKAASDAGQPFDLVLVGQGLSPVDGIETLAAMRRSLGSADMPRSILVASAELPVFEGPRPAGFDAVLAPSWDDESIGQVLEAAFFAASR